MPLIHAMHALLKALAAFALMLWLMPVSAIALDTSAGVGLQDRALFQDRVDYTLTNQSDVDFHGQQLTNTSLPVPSAEVLISATPTCQERSSRKGPLRMPIFMAPTSVMR